MIKKKQRVKHEKDFVLLQKEGISFRLDSLTLRYKGGECRLRVGVVVGVKVNKSAVVRNKLKRRVRAILRELAEAKQLPENGSLVIYTFFGAQELSFDELRTKVKFLVQRVKK